MELLYLYFIYYVVVSIGITFGYHRYFAHRGKKVHPIIECIMLWCGVVCGMQSPLMWSGIHRMHHAYVDTGKDPHSPRYHPWYVILFSTWRVRHIPKRFIKDLLQNPRVMFFHKYKLFIWLFSFGLFPFEVITCTILSYLGFGVLNLFGHNKKGPVNNIFINLIAPFEGNHKDHHVKSS